MKQGMMGVVIAVVILLIGIQVVPYGHDHANPPVQGEPKWSSPQVRELAARACFDCHSNETVWPWYSNVAPMSWLIQRDVDQGRRRLNFSQWNAPQRGSRDVAESIQRGSMPQWYYVMLHPSAKLSSADIQTLVQGLGASLAQQ
jgi:cytochrome c551/c552